MQATANESTADRQDLAEFLTPHHSLAIKVLTRCTIDDLASIRELSDAYLAGTAPGELVNSIIATETDRRDLPDSEPGMVFINAILWPREMLCGFVLAIRVLLRTELDPNVRGFYYALFDIAVSALSIRFELLLQEAGIISCS